MSNPRLRVPAPRLASITCARPVPGGAALADLLVSGGECAWLRFGEGMIGLGTAARFSTTGAGRFEAARHWWARATTGGPAPDAGAPGRSPVAFTAFAFADESPVASVVRVPEIVVGSADGESWLTWQVDLDSPAYAGRAAAGWLPDAAGAEQRLAELLAEAALTGEEAAAAAAPLASGAPAVLAEGAMTADGFRDAVGSGVAAITAGELTKLVLARDAVVRGESPVHVPQVLRELAVRYRDCWTYAVDGLIGSTPEMLVKVDGGLARARVLAGTLDRAGAPAGSEGTAYATRMLFEDEKQRHEHQLAIDSLTERLGPFTTELDAHTTPFVLELPNVWHLASDVTAELTGANGSGSGAARAGVLDLAQALHPTAAVCGTPRDAAAALIRRLEARDHGLDRGLYAGPVGWLDAAGNGEFGIALRGAVVEDEHTVRLYAGCGIVAASDPVAELAETSAKMRPMLQALGLRA